MYDSDCPSLQNLVCKAELWHWPTCNWKILSSYFSLSTWYIIPSGSDKYQCVGQNRFCGETRNYSDMRDVLDSLTNREEHNQTNTHWDGKTCLALAALIPTTEMYVC